ncbi:hypothetical protein RBB84_02525 [Rhodococcus sp. D-6]|uniref:Uncharacterized protein n=1 Tax=Rhodococcus sp. D-6 TaxID=1387842 RepID=A0AAU7UXV8_9NOCA|nr:hypothetical protein [Rhodococcus sp. HS-D2]
MDEDELNEKTPLSDWMRSQLPKVPDSFKESVLPDFSAHFRQSRDLEARFARQHEKDMQLFEQSRIEIEKIQAEKAAQKRADHEELAGLSREQVERMKEYKKSADQHMQIAADHLQVAQEHRAVSEKQLEEAKKLHSTATEQLDEAKKLYDVSVQQLKDAKSSGRWGFRGFLVAVVAAVIALAGAVAAWVPVLDEGPEDAPAQPTIEAPAGEVPAPAEQLQDPPAGERPTE